LKGGSGRNKKGVRNGGSEERKPGRMWIEIRTEDDVRVRQRMKPKSGLETIQNFHLMFSQVLTKGSTGHSTPQCPWQYRVEWKFSYCLQTARETQTLLNHCRQDAHDLSVVRLLGACTNVPFVFKCFHDQQDSQWREKSLQK